MSIQSSFFYLLLRALNYRARTEKQFLFEVETGKHPWNPADSLPPRRIVNNCIVETSCVSGCNVFTIRPKIRQSDQYILFLHGGAFLRTAVNQHWNFIYSLAARFGYTVVVPDYPLAPENSSVAVMGMIEACYREIIAKNHPANIVLMGDSAGGNLALSLAQKMRENPGKQPDHIILLSPWLDLSLTNPGIRENEGKDAFLLVKGLQAAGKAYAGGIPLTDKKVSPIYGEFHQLGKISLFIGTYDIFLADARKLKKICEEQGIGINYFEYPKMIHDWMILGFPESMKVLEQIDEILCRGR